MKVKPTPAVSHHFSNKHCPTTVVEKYIEVSMFL